MVPNTGATLRISSIACVLLSFYKTVSTAKDYLQRTNKLMMPISKRVHALLRKNNIKQTYLVTWWCSLFMMINRRCISGEIQAPIKYTSFNGNVRTYLLKGHSFSWESNKCLNNKDLRILQIFLLHFSDCVL